MSNKNKDKKAKEVKEEIKTPSTEVSENGAEVEIEAGKEEVKTTAPTFSIVDELAYLKGKIAEFANGAREIDVAIIDTTKALEKAISLVGFIQKALSEKKK